MYCTGKLPNDENVRDEMAECDVKEIVSFFNNCKSSKKLEGWQEMKILCLHGITQRYFCVYDSVVDEIKKTRESI